MSETDEIRVLLSEIAKSRGVLARIEQYYDTYSATVDPAALSRENTIVIADILVSYYTCLETVFVRISQHFENSLSSDRWHQDLLSKMTLEIDGTRPRVLSDASGAALQELMRFRHFKRYYFEFDYDVDRLQFLEAKLAAARRTVPADLDAFEGALRSVL